jgi:hypothetical protein
LTGKILLSSHGAIELWFAYNDRTASVLASDVTVDVMRRDQDARIPALEELDQRRFATPIQREVAESEIFLSEAIGYVRAHPAASVRMMPLKLWKFWSWFKTPRTNALNPTAPTSRFASAWDALYTATYTPILLLSLAGLYLARGHWRRHGLLLLLFAGYSALHTLVYGFTRLRVPIDQFLIVYAAFAVVALAAAGRPAAEARPIVTA